MKNKTTETSAEAPKHTPGPWMRRELKNQCAFKGGRQEVSQQIEHVASGITLARVPWNGLRLRERNAANARLIAAAPELLAALKEAKRGIDMFLSACDAKEIKDSFSGMDKASDHAHAAIAKAEGRP